MQTIGERLEEARKRKGISIREAAEATKIRGDYLQKFENNQFDFDLPEIYARGFLRAYAHFLKLPADRILADYKSLGLDEPRPRTPSREVYGRMDLSIASASGAAKESTPVAEPPSESGSAAVSGDTQPRQFARIGTSLPEGTYFDPRLIVKVATICGVVLVAALILWGGISLFHSAAGSKTTAGQMTAKNERTITLVALDTMTVTVATKNSDGTSGEVIFQGTLMRGETRQIPWRTALYISTTSGKDLKIEINGKRNDMPEGYDRGELPAPRTN